MKAKLPRYEKDNHKAGFGGTQEQWYFDNGFGVSLVRLKELKEMKENRRLTQCN